MGCTACTTKTRRSRRTSTRDARDDRRRDGRAAPRGDARARRRGSSACKGELSAPRIPVPRDDHGARATGRGGTRSSPAAGGSSATAGSACAPLPRGSGYVFEDEIVGGAIPSRFIPAVDRGMQEAAARGILAGYPMVDFVVECYDGSYHSVDSNETSFKMAGILAFKTVAPKCRPALLEPLEMVEVIDARRVPGRRDGRPQLAARPHPRHRARRTTGRFTRVRAIVPQADLHLYATQALIAHARARQSSRSGSMATSTCRGDAAAKIIEAAAKNRRRRKRRVECSRETVSQFTSPLRFRLCGSAIRRRLGPVLRRVDLEIREEPRRLRAQRPEHRHRHAPDLELRALARAQLQHRPPRPHVRA